MRIHTLRINGLRQPQYVDSKFQFSWILESDFRDTSQTSYEIKLFREDSLVWESGEIVSEKVYAIPYTGPKLEQLKSYLWQVTSTNCRGEKATACDTFRTCKNDGVWYTNWVQPLQIQNNQFRLGVKRFYNQEIIMNFSQHN